MSQISRRNITRYGANYRCGAYPFPESGMHLCCSAKAESALIHMPRLASGHYTRPGPSTGKMSTVHHNDRRRRHSDRNFKPRPTPRRRPSKYLTQNTYIYSFIIVTFAGHSAKSRVHQATDLALRYKILIIWPREDPRSRNYNC